MTTTTDFNDHHHGHDHGTHAFWLSTIAKVLTPSGSPVHHARASAKPLGIPRSPTPPSKTGVSVKRAVAGAPRTEEGQWPTNHFLKES